MREWFAFRWAQIVSRETIEEDKVFYVHSRKEAWDKIHKPKGAARYVIKYATKAHQKIVPINFRDVGRFWGCSRNVVPKATVQNIDIDENELRQMLHSLGHQCAEWDVLPKYLYGTFDKG